MESDRKRQRTDGLRSLLHVGSISVRGLEELLAEVARGGVTNASRRALMESNSDLFQRHRVVDRMPLLSGGDFQWEYMAPNRWLASLVDRSPGLQELFDVALRRTPCSFDRPWSLVLGFLNRKPSLFLHC